MEDRNPPMRRLRTRISAAYTALAIGAAILIVILVFILQNPRRAEITFLVFSASLPLGVALLFAALAGALVVLAVGTARILQLRRTLQMSTHLSTHPAISTPDSPDDHGSPSGEVIDTPPKELKP
jgi:uncharacterized integral membrane protein